LIIELEAANTLWKLQVAATPPVICAPGTWDGPAAELAPRRRTIFPLWNWPAMADRPHGGRAECPLADGLVDEFERGIEGLAHAAGA
jgi:hypothetical protein